MAYNLDITKTAVLLAAYEQKKKPTTFYNQDTSLMAQHSEQMKF